MATGALDAQGIWQYGEDDSASPASTMLNKLASSTSTQFTADRVQFKTRPIISVTVGKTGTPPVGAQLLEKVNFENVTTGASGVLPAVTFGTAFPNGLVGIWMQTLVGSATNPVVNSGLVSTTGFTAIVVGTASGTAVQYCWRAVGW